MSDILIVVGTESGNAQMVGEMVGDELALQGYSVQIASEGDAQSLELAHRPLVLICCSTHGDGELPDNIMPLAESLRTEWPDLSGVRYGVIALGDMTHEHFCAAGRDIDKLFASLGAHRVGERLEIDACETPLPDIAAVEWVKDWVRQL